MTTAQWAVLCEKAKLQWKFAEQLAWYQNWPWVPLGYAWLRSAGVKI